jgi:antitoxin VapB
MTFRIESLETVQLIRELAERTGESTETAVEVSVRERVARLRTPEEEERRRARLDALIASVSARLPEPYRSLDHGDWLYGEDGLPK